MPSESKDVVQISGDQVIALMRHAQSIGTEGAAINLAADWIRGADAEISRLRSLLSAANDPVVDGRNENGD